MDVGYNHPTAVAFLAKEPLSGDEVRYWLYNIYSEKEKTYAQTVNLVKKDDPSKYDYEMAGTLIEAWFTGYEGVKDKHGELRDWVCRSNDGEPVVLASGRPRFFHNRWIEEKVPMYIHENEDLPLRSAAYAVAMRRIAEAVESGGTRGQRNCYGVSF